MSSQLIVVAPMRLPPLAGIGLLVTIVRSSSCGRGDPDPFDRRDRALNACSSWVTWPRAVESRAGTPLPPLMERLGRGAIVWLSWSAAWANPKSYSYNRSSCCGLIRTAGEMPVYPCSACRILSLETLEVGEERGDIGQDRELARVGERGPCILERSARIADLVRHLKAQEAVRRLDVGRLTVPAVSRDEELQALQHPTALVDTLSEVDGGRCGRGGGRRQRSTARVAEAGVRGDRLTALRAGACGRGWRRRSGRCADHVRGSGAASREEGPLRVRSGSWRHCRRRPTPAFPGAKSRGRSHGAGRPRPSGCAT